MKYQNIQPVEDFNWDEFEQGGSLGSTSRQEQEAAYDNTLSNIKAGELVKGKVAKISKRAVTVNVGFKSQGEITASEFRYNPELQIGDEVEVLVVSPENRLGQLELSHSKARAARSWDLITAALEKDEVVRGYIKDRTKAGMIVDIFGVEAFLPGSQIDVRPIRDYDAYLNKTMDFKIVKINPEYRNVVVSHKVLIEAELEAQRAEIVSKLDKGQILEGVVKNITSYGVFVDLGGIDGLVHITDLSWGRVSHPSEVVQLDQKINVVILEFDPEKKRIALGLKQLQPHPWEVLDANLSAGDKIKGKVVVVADYGAFVEVAPGVEGLVHVSEMAWTQHLRSAQDFLKVGDEIEAQILSIDREERKMSLGIKQLKPDPWTGIEERYPVGSQHKARVRNFTTFGAFVELEEGIEGLVHISDLSWTKKVKHPSEFTEVGAIIDIQVLEIDVENRRLSLGHKQTEENPWTMLEGLFRAGTVHTGEIVNITDKGAVVALPEGIEGFATPRHLVKEDGSQPKKGETLEFKVLEFNKDSKRIIVSHSRVYEDLARAEKNATERAERAERAERSERKARENSNAAAAVAANNASSERATLGDLDDVLAELKKKLS